MDIKEKMKNFNAKETAKGLWADLKKGVKVVGKKCSTFYHKNPDAVVAVGVTGIATAALAGFVAGTANGFQAGKEDAAQTVGATLARCAADYAKIEAEDSGLPIEVDTKMSDKDCTIVHF